MPKQMLLVSKVMIEIGPAERQAMSFALTFMEALINADATKASESYSCYLQTRSQFSDVVPNLFEKLFVCALAQNPNTPQFLNGTEKYNA